MAAVTFTADGCVNNNKFRKCIPRRELHVTPLQRVRGLLIHKLFIVSSALYERLRHVPRLIKNVQSSLYG